MSSLSNMPEGVCMNDPRAPWNDDEPAWTEYVSWSIDALRSGATALWDCADKQETVTLLKGIVEELQSYLEDLE